jgi:Ca2+/Na+ antiporter
MNNEVLGAVAGVIFVILGLAILIRFKKLTSHRYYQYLIVTIAIMAVCFGVYLALRSFYLYG